MKIILAITLLILCSNSFAASQRSTKISQQLASGVIGCPPQSISISDYVPTSKNPFINSVHTFGATCNGITYYCSYLYPNPVTCKEDPNSKQETAEDRIKKSENMEIWKANVLDKTMRNWDKPESLEGMIDSEMNVRVDSKGNLVKLHWIKPTGNRKIDRSIVNAFKKASPFTIPPDTTQAFNGVSIIFPANPKP